METSSSSPPPPQDDGGMEINHPSATIEWDWGDLLDFTVEDHFPISFDTVADVTQPINDPPPIETQQVQVQVPDASDRVRKRDPRLSCSNFLAGRVPCACPEMDAKLLEEEEALPGKKRVRVTRAGSGISRCQVPGCEADISELKGYHKRHRVCLRCANATTVLLDGVTKRYCQQCGKFHVLSDFDEGKRSCRRKLERHNNRRRRKAVDSCKGSAVDKEAQRDLLTEDNTCDDEGGKDGLCTIGLIEEKEGLVESEDRHAATINSDPNSQNVNSDSGVSFAASGETQLDGGKDDSKLSFSPSPCGNKSAYSSMCPTGRISFKLYDWNPAEFPRRLRHQIFQWLASMPVELEGYIRPGCTILTAFIAMPTFMWVKLFEDPVSYLHDLLDHGKMLSKKGRMLVYLNNMVFNITKDRTSVMKVNVKAHAPRLHYVHPLYFEAGKPLEFVVCGSNLLQPKFRFLVSFAGKYLAHDYCIELPQMHAKRGSGLHHQLYKIVTSCVEPNHFGPAFIEVENESGLSNFIPVLIGDREICSEMKAIQQRVDASHSSRVSQCEVFIARQMAFLEFIVDIAWMLKEPSVENSQQNMTSPQIQRSISLLNFLLHHESTTILDKILQNLKIIVDKTKVSGVANGTGDTGIRLLQKYMDCASDILCKKYKRSEGLKLQLEYATLEMECISRNCCGISMPSVPPTSENLEQRPNGELGVMTNSNSIGRSDEDPLLNRDVIMSVNLIKERPSKPCGLILSNRVLKYRRTIFVVAIVAVCFGACAILLHPYKVSKLAVSIRRCLTDG